MLPVVARTASALGGLPAVAGVAGVGVPTATAPAAVDALPAGLLLDVPFLSLTGLFLASLGYVMVVMSLLIGLTRLRRVGSGLVVGGLAAWLLVF